MATGVSNKLAGQIGEFLVCAELGRRGYIATSFTGNVPEFDLIVTDSKLKTVPIQVKTTRGTNWPSSANLWIDIDIDDKRKVQIDNGNKQIEHPDLIYVCVMISETDSGIPDRFFILKKRELQLIVTRNYREYMDSKNWKRPRNYRSMDNRYYVENLLPFEGNWDLIRSELSDC